MGTEGNRREQKGIEEQGARTRNDVPSEARDQPILTVVLLHEDGYPLAPGWKFKVSKAKLQDGLEFIGQANGEEQREARRRQVFSALIATSHK